MIIRDGTHEVKIFKAGTEFNKENLPYFFNSISHVEAKVGYNTTSRVTVVLTPSYNDALKILRSGLLGVGGGLADQKPAKVTGGLSSAISSSSLDSSTSTPASSSSSEDITLKPNTSYLMARFFYPGQTNSQGEELSTPWYTGMMIIPKIDMSGTDITITLVVRGTLAILNDFMGVTSFKNRPALDVILEMADIVGVAIASDPTDTSTLKHLKSFKISGVFNEPKIQSIKSILHQADCFWTETSGEDKDNVTVTLKVMLRRNLPEKKIEHTFVMYRQVDTANNVFPIFNFSLSGASGMFFSGQAFGTFQRCIDDKTNKVVKLKTTVKDSNDSSTLSGSKNVGGSIVKSEPQEGGGALGAINTKDKELTGASKLAVMTSEANNINEIKSSAAKASFLGPKYTLTVPGIPKLRTLTLAQVIVGDEIPGVSSVGQLTSVIHMSSSEGWVSNIEIKQTGGYGTFAGVANKNVEKDAIASTSSEKSSVGF